MKKSVVTIYIYVDEPVVQTIQASVAGLGKNGPDVNFRW
jgi:hypothetical protein